MAEVLNKDAYKVLVVGPTGAGKTMNARSLDPETTGFINAENKPLPFKNRFKYYSKPLTWKETYNQLIEYGKNPEIKTIYIDSFSAFTDLLLADARKSKKNFDIWNMYNEEIGNFLSMIKRVPQHVFITGHYEILGIEGNQEKRLKVRAKEWEGMVEKEFTIVLYAGSTFDSTTSKPKYFLNLYEENTSAKCPPGIFGDNVLRIENDAKVIVDKLNSFVNE